MAEKERAGGPRKRISDAQRFRYIGFEVFPGKPKDLFKSEDERKGFVDAILARRDKGKTIREHATLLEDRVSFVDRLVLTIACIVVVGSLFLPWYSVYNEVAEERAQAAAGAEVMPDSAMLAVDAADTLAAASATADSIGPTGTELVAETEPAGEGAVERASERVSAVEEVIHGYVAKKKIRRDYDRLSGLGSLLALGSAGSYVFSSGAVLAVTAVIFLAYTLLCIGLPVYTMFGVYGVKGSPDEKALRLKKILRFSWAPLILFVLVVILSFLGAEYGFDPTVLYSSIGDSYGPGTLLSSISWGVVLSVSAFILTAVKGIEI